MKPDQKKMQQQFGQSIKRLRDESGISRRKMCKMVCMDERLMARYEEGITCPSLYAAAKISQFFCVELRTMFEPLEMGDA